MCVICYIPKNSNNLKYEDIRKMWNHNPDGAGIMWIDDENKVYFKKGYFNLYELYRDYLIIKEDYNFECALHFRIATSGGINEKMCHPFVMTNEDEIIAKTKGCADVLVMHNGIINIKNRPNFSDTAEYIINRLYPRYEKDTRFFLHYEKKDKFLIENEIGFSNKILLFSGEGVDMIGKWFEYKGTYCSNLYFDYEYEY